MQIDMMNCIRSAALSNEMLVWTDRQGGRWSNDHR